jgi:hypothetical protein
VPSVAIARAASTVLWARQMRPYSVRRDSIVPTVRLPSCALLDSTATLLEMLLKCVLDRVRSVHTAWRAHRLQRSIIARPDHSATTLASAQLRDRVWLATGAQAARHRPCRTVARRVATALQAAVARLFVRSARTVHFHFSATSSGVCRDRTVVLLALLRRSL